MGSSDVTEDDGANVCVGVMIGEMWDLERLCDKAEELKRYTCFVSSVPLKVSEWSRSSDIVYIRAYRLINEHRCLEAWPLHQMPSQSSSHVLNRIITCISTIYNPFPVADLLRHVESYSTSRGTSLSDPSIG